MYRFKSVMSFHDRFKDFMHPGQFPDLETLSARPATRLPTLWLLGKTGAGKSTLIQTVTGNTRVQIGNGFSPCTRTAASYDFPEDRPLIRFLDTRGLADAGYDPTGDIEACQNRAHTLVVVMKAEEPEQSEVVKALRKIRRSGRITQALLVHTGICLVENVYERRQCISHNRQQAEKAWGRSIVSVEVDFDPEGGMTRGVDLLKQTLADRVPVIGRLITAREHADREEKIFARLKAEVLWYAGAAGASDAAPVVGVFSVPAIQAKMLHALSGRYSIKWDGKNVAEFAGALGAGIGARYAARAGIRQVVRLIPVYGPVAGGASAAAASFYTTYAMGRVACKYMYHKSRGESVSEDELRRMYKEALDGAKAAAENEANG